jgi:clan AA aspartic protease (TIGR02281 family)
MEPGGRPVRTVVLLLIMLLASGPALAQTPLAPRPCQDVDELNIHDPHRPDETFTTPPYVALSASGELQRLARRGRSLHRQLILSAEKVACLVKLTGTRLSAVKAGMSYRYKIQTEAGVMLIFHVADLVGSEAIVLSQVERLLANAERFLENGNLSEASKAYKEALKANPRPAEQAVAYTALGRLAKEEGRPKVALLNFREALKAYPNYIPALEEIASTARALEDIEKARQANEALIELVPSRPGPYIELVQLAHARGDRAEMFRTFRKLQAVNPSAAARLAREIPELRSLETVRKQAPVVKDVLEIPLRRRPGGVLLAEVSVNGSQPLTFIVDTGASLVSLKGSTVQSLGIELDPNRVGILRTAKGTRPARIITIERMEIGGIEARNVLGVVLDENFGEDVEGLLGQSFLNKIRARIDLAKQLMVVE